MKVLPRIVLCVPGVFDADEDFASIVGDLEFDVRPHDARIGTAFRAAQSRRTVPAADLASIEKHAQVVYVLSDSFERDDAAATAHHMLRVGRALIARGGAGVKCESSGVAHSRHAWRTLCEASDAAIATRPATVASRYRFWGALFDAFVQEPIVGDRDVYSCGMHLLGARDVVLDRRFATACDQEGYVTRDYVAFAQYTLAESEVRAQQTFSAGPEAPRFVIAEEPCRRYEEDDFFFNPYGYARLVPLD